MLLQAGAGNATCAVYATELGTSIVQPAAWPLQNCTVVLLHAFTCEQPCHFTVKSIKGACMENAPSRISTYMSCMILST